MKDAEAEEGKSGKNDDQKDVSTSFYVFIVVIG